MKCMTSANSYSKWEASAHPEEESLQKISLFPSKGLLLTLLDLTLHLLHHMDNRYRTPIPRANTV